MRAAIAVVGFLVVMGQFILMGCSGEANGVELEAPEAPAATPLPTPDVNYNFDVRHVEPEHWVKNYKVNTFTTDGCVFNLVLRNGGTMAISGHVRVTSR